MYKECRICRGPIEEVCCGRSLCKACSEKQKVEMKKFLKEYDRRIKNGTSI